MAAMASSEIKRTSDVDVIYCEKAQKVLTSVASGEKLSHVDLSNCGLTFVPEEIFDLGDSLELLNLGGNSISTLPDSMIRLHKLRILFFAQNKFENIPTVLGKLSSLFMLSFKSNQVSFIDSASLSPSLCWLILTDNKISELPSSIGKLSGLRKLMLAGNEITHLNDELQHCRELELVRLAANKLNVSSLPSWFWKLPKLSWLAIAGNSCDAENEIENKEVLSVAGINGKIPSKGAVNLIDWTDLEIMEKLGEGASGVIYKAKWPKRDIGSTGAGGEFVAVKLFKGGKTSDGLPEDEMKASEAAGCHECSFEVLGRIINAPHDQLGLVMPLIPCEYAILGGPPSFTSVTRDTFEAGHKYRLEVIVRILTGISGVCAHLHSRGIAHGDIYAHNILVNGEGKPLLSDFGASSFYAKTSASSASDAVLCNSIPGTIDTISAAMEGFEVRAFGCLIDDLLGRVSDSTEDATINWKEECSTKRSFGTFIRNDVISVLRTLQAVCMGGDPRERPTFKVINARLAQIVMP